jgi:iron complex transport system substrate-binding protein
MSIVSLLPSATEILFAIGAGDDVVAVTHECDFPEEARALPAITSSVFDHEGKSCAHIDRHIKQALHQGSSIYRLDNALLARLNPDLIVTQELCDVCAVSYRHVAQAVRSIDSGATVVSLEPSSIEDILSTMLVVGDHTGHSVQAVAVVDRLKARLVAVRNLSLPQYKPRIVCVEWTDPLMVGGHWVPEMVELAGGQDVLGVAHQPSRWVDASTINEASPDIIVLMPCGFGLDETAHIGDELMSNGAPSWFGKAGVVAVDGSSYFNRPGPRMVDGVELLATLFRGEMRDGRRTKARWVRQMPALA